jgi:hypothetical protein
MINEERFLSMKERQKGSIIIYILIAIFLTGLLVATMTQGSKKTAESTQLDNMMLFMQNDIQTMQNNVAECVQTYPSPINASGAPVSDAAFDPNEPFPLYCANSACALATMTNGSSGTALANAGCPGAPDNQRVIFTNAIGAGLKLLNDANNFNATFFNAADGVYVRITRAFYDPLWMEAISRLPSKYAACSSIARTSNPDETGFNCTNGCFYYFILRKSGGVFSACP